MIRNKFVKQFLIFGILFLVFMFCFFVFRTKEITSTDFIFITKDSIISNISQQIKFDLNVSKLKKDSIYIDFDDEKSMVFIDKNQKEMIYQYKKIGYYQVKLLYGKKILKVIPIHIIAANWECYLISNNNLFIANLTQHIDSGFLKINPVTISNRKQLFDSTYNSTNYCLSKDFNVKADSIVFSMRFRNESNNNQFNSFFITLACKMNKLPLHFFDEKLPQHNIDSIKGTFNDLSSIPINLSEWQELMIVIKEMNVSVYINFQKKYSIPYTVEFGTLKSISIQSSGIASIDNVKLYDKDGDVTFRYTFD